MPPQPKEPRTLIALATYNERDNLEPLVRQIRAAVPSADVLVTDDNSPDGTGKAADALAAADPQVRALHRPAKQGLGTATVEAMRYALEHGYDQVVSMDADFSHHPRYLAALLGGMARHDVMIGSRYIPGGGTLNWPRSRRLMSWAVNALVRVLMRLPARDTSGGFRCYRVAKLREMDLGRVRSLGYSFQQEMLYHCRKAGCRIGETPILFEDRRVGSSKAGLREAVQSMAMILRIGLPAFFGLDEPVR